MADQATDHSGADRKIDYVEFNVSDIARAKAFYGGAFGWTFTDYGPDYCEFRDGRLSGGFTTLAPVTAKGGPLVILFAADLEGALARVERGRRHDRQADLPLPRRPSFPICRS